MAEVTNDPTIEVRSVAHEAPRFEPRCRICTVPPDVRGRAEQMRVEGYSIRVVTAFLNAELKERGLLPDHDHDVLERSVSTHLRRHVAGADTAARLLNDLKPGNTKELARSASEAASLLQSARFRSAEEHLAYVLDVMVDEFGALSVGLDVGGQVTADQERTLRMQIALSREIRSAIATLDAMRSPRLAASLFVDASLHGLGADLRQVFISSIRSIGKTAEAAIEDSVERSRFVDTMKHEVEVLKARFIEIGIEHESQAKELLAA